MQALIAQALSGGDGASAALRLAELQVLQQLAGALQGKRSDPASQAEMLFGGGLAGDEAEGSGAASAPRGTANLLRVRQNVQRYPDAWWGYFNDQVQEALGTTYTGLPWSLQDYIEKRMRFTTDQEDEQRFAYILARMHALAMRGPDAHPELSALIAQSFKALEQKTRDRQWGLAWVWTGLPDPRPHGVFHRGLTHPIEHAAGIAYLRELQTLQSHRQGLLGGGGAGSGSGEGAAPSGGPGDPRRPRQPPRRP